jgi:hypothetical protein
MPLVVGSVHEISFGYGGLVGLWFGAYPLGVMHVAFGFAEDSVEALGGWFDF